MRRLLLLSPFACSVCLVALPAQGFVSPAHFATVEGTGNSSLPFGQANLVPFRFLQVHDGVPALNVSAIAFRHDTTGTLRPAYSLTVDVWMSTATVAAAGALATFDNNHGVDKMQVVTNRTVQVPANDPANLPGAFLLDLPFDTGVVFPFAGGSASLCWEVHVTANSNTTNIIPFDAVLTQGSTPSSPWLLGTRAHIGCVSTGQTMPMQAVPANSPIDWSLGTGIHSVNASRLQPNGIIVWVNGTSTAPLPFELPGSAVGPSGACSLWTDLAVLTPAVASAAGTAQLAQPLGVSTALHGALLPVQAVGLDAAANSFGFTTSNLVVQQLVAPYPAAIGIRRVYSPGALAATGTVDGNSPLIVWLR